MQITPYINQKNSIEHLKKDMLDKLQAGSLDEKTLEDSLAKTFGEGKSFVYYDDEYLVKAGDLSACHYSGEDGKQYFIFREDLLSPFRNKPLSEIKKEGNSDSVAEAFNDVLHEAQHGVFGVENDAKYTAIEKQAKKIMTKDNDLTKFFELSFKLYQKVMNEYEEPHQLKKVVDRVASVFVPGNQKQFKRLLSDQLMLHSKDEQKAYTEGFKVKKQMIGEQASFFSWGIDFEGAKEYITGCRAYIQEELIDNIVPLSKKIK